MDNSHVSNRGQETIVITAIFFLALLLRITNINAPLWGDELTTAWVSRLDLISLLNDRVAYGHSPLYFVISKYLIQFFGEGKWVLRLPGIVFGALSPVLLILAVKRWLPWPAVLLAGVLAACNNLNIFIAQSARMYGAMSFLEVLYFAAVLRWVHFRSNSWYAVYCITIICGCLLHDLFFRLILVSLAIATLHWAMFRKTTGNGGPARALKKNLQMVALLTLPFLVSLLLTAALDSVTKHVFNTVDAAPRYTMEKGYIPPPEPLPLPREEMSQIQRATPSYSVADTVSTVMALPFGVAATAPMEQNRPGVSMNALLIGANIVCLICILAGIRFSQPPQTAVETSPDTGKMTQWVILSALLWALLPVVVLMLHDFKVGMNILVPRYITSSTLGISVVMAVGFSRITSSLSYKRFATALLIGGALTFSLIGITSFSEGQKPVISYWESHRQPGERTYFFHAGYWMETLRQENSMTDSSEYGGTARPYRSADTIAIDLTEFAGADRSFWILVFPNGDASYTKAIELLKPAWQVREEYHRHFSSAFKLQRLK